MLDHLELRLIGTVFRDLVQILFRRTSVRAIDDNPAIFIGGLVSLIDNAADARPKTMAPKITVFAFISSSALGRIQLVTTNRVSFFRNSCRGRVTGFEQRKLDARGAAINGQNSWVSWFHG